MTYETWKPSRLYSSNFEDLYLWRCFKYKVQGFYVDIGACNPIDSSPTRIFYEQGWQGINFHSDMHRLESLRRYRIRDINTKALHHPRQDVRKDKSFDASNKNTPRPRFSNRSNKSSSDSFHLPELSELIRRLEIKELDFLRFAPKEAGLTPEEVLALVTEIDLKPRIVLVSGYGSDNYDSNSLAETCSFLENTLLENYFRWPHSPFNIYYIRPDEEDFFKLLTTHPSTADGVELSTWTSFQREKDLLRALRGNENKLKAHILAKEELERKVYELTRESQMLLNKVEEVIKAIDSKNRRILDLEKKSQVALEAAQRNEEVCRRFIDALGRLASRKG
jgi:hypothetical protein